MIKAPCVAALLCMILLSCQKAVDEVLPEETPEPEETRDSTLIHKFAEMDYSRGPDKGDTLTMYSWKYDDQKRVIEFREEEFGDDPADYYLNKIVYRYTNQADKFPWLAVRETTPDPGSQAVIDSMFLKYEGGFVKQDSVRTFILSTNEWLGYTTHNVKLNGDKVDLLIRRVTAGQPEIHDERFSISAFRENGNLVRQIGSDTDPDGSFHFSTYNNHPDPRHRGYIPFVIPYHVWEWGIEAYPNLLTDYRYEPYSSPGVSTETLKMTYTYRADGYPLTSIWDGSAGGMRETLDEIYIYY